MNMQQHAISAILAALAVFAPLAHSQTPSTPQPHAFYVVEIQVTDPEGIKPYIAQVESTFKPFSGRFVVRGGRVTPLEGEAPKGRLVMIEFDSLEQAQAWYDSPAYQSIVPIRHRSAKSRAMILETTPPR